MTERFTIDSPLGSLTVESDGDSLTGLSISATPLKASGGTPSSAVLAHTCAQLDEYFAGTRKDFDLPLSVTGTAFQNKVWNALREIPYGDSTSYQELGKSAGVGSAPRAVGGAVGANPIPIVIPCHRVLSATQTLTGYSAGQGVETKKILLDLEGISYR